MVHGKSRLQGYKNSYVGSPSLRCIIHPSFFGVLGEWMTFKKAEMKKLLRKGLSLSETDSLDHKRLDFAI